jgi:hypothetical protein
MLVQGQRQRTSWGEGWSLVALGQPLAVARQHRTGGTQRLLTGYWCNNVPLC